MKVIRTQIPEVLILEPKVFGDERGFFVESHNKRTFREATGLDVEFVQDNHSSSRRGVLRGLHYQVRQPQGKIVRVIAGEVFDVAVDLRRSSPTFGKVVTTRLDAGSKRMAWIPPGFAHGFLVLSEQAEFIYKTTDYYAPQHERTLLWNDPALGIRWPLEGQPILSTKDADAPPLARAELFPVKILLTGPTGQVGSALLDTLPSLGEVVPADRSDLDLSRPDSIRAAVRAARADVIVNAAAYTAVDQAESEEALAFRVNRDGPALLAEEAAKLGALLVHFSTDYVFDGEKPTPYVETDAPNPLNVYGRSKLAGEQAIQSSGCRHLIFRTSWIYAATGKNFMLTVLRLAREGKPVRVVDDQRGAPTSNLMLAGALAKILVRASADPALGGVYHMTAGGKTTWHDFARAIFQATGTAARLSSIPSSEYKTAAHRPRNSVLENQKLASRLHVRLPSWEDGLREVVQALR